MEITASVTVNLEDLMYDINRYLSHDEIVDFIQDLDLQAADWDLTEKLYRYFKDQHKIFKAEM
jgi:hypothetical protein